MSHPDPVTATATSPSDAGVAVSRRGFALALIRRSMAPAIVVLLGSSHGLAIWLGMGGYAGLTNGWPLYRDDHPLYFHSALVTRSFLAQSWTTAGYDPNFMAGYAKSVVFPASSTLPELVVAAFGGAVPSWLTSCMSSSRQRPIRGSWPGRVSCWASADGQRP